MKYLKRFNETENLESKIEDYLKQQFPSEWFDSQLQDRVYDYIDTEEAEEYDGNPVEAYKNLSTGAAIEYDLCSEMTSGVCQEFGVEADKKIGERSPMDIVHDHVMDYCTWKDNFVFNRRSTEPYKSMFGFGSSYNNLLSKWSDTDGGDIKL